MSRKRIHFGRIQAARKRLKQIAKEHPELLGESSPENVRGWESILAENEMGKTTLVGFRFENERRIGDPRVDEKAGPPLEHERKVRLDHLLGEGKRCIYEYDFGDGSSARPSRSIRGGGHHEAGAPREPALGCACCTSNVGSTLES